MMEIADLVKRSHAYAVARGFWDVDTVRESELRNEGLLLSLIASEAFEAVAEHRRGLDGWEERCALELADCVIRVADFCGAMGWDLADAIMTVQDTSVKRPSKHGKRY